MMISAGILVLFIVIPSETCIWIPTVEQQDFCSAQYGKLVNNENFYAKPTYSRVRYMLARSIIIYILYNINHNIGIFSDVQLSTPQL